MSGIGVNLRVTGHCSQGGRKYMEDMFSVAYQQTVDLNDLEYAFFGIFDGHGGPQAATYAKEHLLDSIVNQRNFWADDDETILKAIRDGYLSTHLAMWKDLEKWPKTTTGLPSTSGTTATIAFVMKGKLYIGHVGDTAIVLGYEEDGTKEWKARVLTTDHKPDQCLERNRIEQDGGRVVNKSGVPRVVWNRPRIGHQGPIRRSTPIDEIPFLAVARSLGDFWSYNSALGRFVVSPEPDVFVCPVDVMNFRCLILGTDGLWNMMTPDRAVSIVQATELHNKNQHKKNLNNQCKVEWLNPSKMLVDKALTRWVTTNLRADNTSVVTLLLDPPGPPRAQMLLTQMELNKSNGASSPIEGGESTFTVPKSGGMAIFTRYPLSEEIHPILKEKATSEIESSSEEKENEKKMDNELISKHEENPQKVAKIHDAELGKEDSKLTSMTKPTLAASSRDSSSGKEENENKCGNEFVPNNDENLQKLSKIKDAQLQLESGKEYCEESLNKSTAVITDSLRFEEKSRFEEINSDTENETVFPGFDLKKRRLSQDKKSSVPGTHMRPSIAVLKGKFGSLCKSRSLPKSTRMLRSATPTKTLRSRNIDLSDHNAGSAVHVKRSQVYSPPVSKKLRCGDDEQSNTVLGKCKLPNTSLDPGSTKSSFLKPFLEHEIDNDLFYNDDKTGIEDVNLVTKQLLKERKHKSTSSLMFSKWKNTSLEECKSQSVSDSELQSMLSFVPHNKRTKVQENGSKRMLKEAMPTSKSTPENVFDT